MTDSSKRSSSSSSSSGNNGAVEEEETKKHSSVKLHNFKITPRLEAALRISVTTLFASSLSLASLSVPHAIPPSLASVIGVLAPYQSLQNPHTSCLIGITLLVAFGGSLVGMVGSSALLAAASVSNGWYVAAFALWALLCKSLYYGPGSKTTRGFSHALLLMGAMVSLTMWEPVQNGLGVEIDVVKLLDSISNNSSTDINMDLWTKTAYELIKAQASNICSSSENCIDELSAALSPPGESFMVPPIGDNSIFAGQTATISCVDNICTISIPGGLWLIGGMWKWTGANNPFAVVSNFFIVLCYFLVCVYAGILIPPIRTVRQLYSRGVLPAAISDCVALLEANEEKFRKNRKVDEGGVQGALMNNDEASQRGDTGVSTSITDNNSISTLKMKVIRHAVENSTGGKAAFTAYEVRCLSQPLECTWPKLREVAKSVSEIALYSLSTEMRGKMQRHETLHEEEKFANYMEAIKKSAAALKSNDLVPDERHIDDDDEHDSGVPPQSDEEEQSKNDSYFTRKLARLSNKLTTNTTSWVESMNNPKYTGLKDTAMTYLPWMAPTAILYKSLVWNLLLPFMPQRWNLRTTMLAVKFCAGVVILLILEVYIPNYKNFAIGSPTSDGLGIIKTTSTAPNLYSGWNLFSYVFCTLVSTEGTFKKGFFRLGGTVVGGFLGWLSIIVCSGSYADDATINLYGLVTWLTVSACIVSYFSLPDGPTSYAGMDVSHGMGGKYCLLVQSLCAIEVAIGGNPGQRDVIVTNRIVATLTGVAMAMLFAVIPPQSRGSDLEPMFSLLTFVETTFKKGMLLILEEGFGSEGESAAIEENGRKKDLAAELESLSKEFMSNYLESKSKIDVLLNDASKLNGAPLLRVDKRLVQALQALSVMAVYVETWLGCARFFELNQEQRKVLRDELRWIIQHGVGEERKKDGDGGEAVIGSDREDLDLLLHSARFINSELELLRAKFEELPSCSFVAVCRRRRNE